MQHTIKCSCKMVQSVLHHTVLLLQCYEYCTMVRYSHTEYGYIQLPAY